MPQLNPEFFVTQLFWLVVTFSFLLVFLWRISLPRIGNVLEKTFYFDGENVLRIDDSLELVSSSFGNISAFKTFYRNKNKS